MKLLQVFVSICLVLSIMLFGVCSAKSNKLVSPTPTSVPTPNQYPWEKTFVVPYTKQPDGYTCGPTSLKMLMAYYGTSQEVKIIGEYMASIGDSPWDNSPGVAFEYIISAAKNYGFSTATVKYGWDELKSALAAGKPCIAHIYCSGDNYPRYYPSDKPAYKGSIGHYVVVVGLKADANGNVLYVECNDPARDAGVRYTYSSWDAAWGGRERRLITLQ